MLKIVDPGKLEWSDPPRGYYLSEVKEKVLWRDEETGAKIAMVKAPVGVMDRRHTHPEANQFAMRLTGEMKWVSSHIPMGEEHGRSMVEEETIAIFFWDGPPKPEVVE